MAQGDAVHHIELEVNGERVAAVVLARQLLVHYIRDGLGLTGTHIGCDTGDCGACTVRLDGRLTKSCMLLAVQADGRELETVEGMGAQELTPLQAAFHSEHALQCGYCTAGLLASAQFLVERNPDPTSDEIRRALKGNLCRCTGYENVVRAVERAAESLRDEARAVES
jgi:carbon-monoxide dehydrogenase small subunit